MALRADVVGDRFGRVVLDGDRVRSFIAPGQGATGPVNAGVYVVARGILARVGGLPASLEQDVFPALVADGAMRLRNVTRSRPRFRRRSAAAGN